MTDTTIKPIDFMDIDGSLANEFCRIVADDGIDAGVDFAVAHSGYLHDDNRRESLRPRVAPARTVERERAPGPKRVAWLSPRRAQ